MAGHARVADLLELIKPGIVLWVLVTVAAGYVLAAGSLSGLTLFHTLLGAALVAGASNSLNQVLERDVDAHMARTRGRPLPAGRMAVRSVVFLGAGMGIVGLAWLAVFTPPLTTACAAATLGLYVFVYTPLKRVTSLSTLVGAVPGALPIVGGWAAAGRGIEPMSVTLFGILFLWQLPHFLALAWLYRDEYEAAGLRMLSVTGGEDATFRQALIYGLALVPSSLTPTLIGAVGSLYFVGAVLLGGAFVGITVVAMRKRARKDVWRLFTASVVYLPALLALMVVDRI